MRILHTVEFYSPAVGGAEEVVKQLSVRLAARGHDVTVATTALPERTRDVIDGVQVVGFEVSGNAVLGYGGEDVERYKDFLRDGDFDVVMNYAAQQWTADIFFEVMDGVRAAKVFVPCGFSALHNPHYADYFLAMPTVLKRYDATVFLAERYRDVDFARDHGVTNGHLIPNGAGEDEFSEISPTDASEFRRAHGINGLLVTTLGNHTGTKGHGESLRAFMRARTGQATLAIIGAPTAGGCFARCRRVARAINLLSSVTGKQVLLLQLPREETVRALKASDVFLFLSNIEASPIVLFEAAAAGVPFVASPAGNSEEIAEWTGGGVIVAAERRTDGLVVASTRSASAKLEELAQDPERRHELGTAGRAAWRAKFTWERIADRYEDLYRQLVNRERPAPTARD